jgi:hypothetical protein
MVQNTVFTDIRVLLKVRDISAGDISYRLLQMEEVRTPTTHHSLGVNYMYQGNVPLFTSLVSRFKQFARKESCLATYIQLQMLQAYKRHIITRVR